MGRFVRPSAPRRLGRKVFVAAEGAVTEEEYLGILRDLGCDELHIVRSRTGKSAPRHVLARMNAALSTKSLRSTDEAWLLVDRDEWKASDMEALFTWAKKDARRHVVVSNPCFEFWLLLHFEDGGGATDAEMCRTRLKNFLPGYSDKNKHLPSDCLTEDRIWLAVARAESLCAQKSWTEPCSTTLQHLVRSLLERRS